MIKITLHSLPLDGSLANQIDNTKHNQDAEAYVKSLEMFLKGKTCNLHPRMNQEVIVSLDHAKKMNVAKNNFCCDRFNDSIDLSLVQAL